MSTRKHFGGRAKFDAGVFRLGNSFNESVYSGYFEAPFVFSTPFYFEMAGIKKAAYVAKITVFFPSVSETLSTLSHEIEGAFDIFIEDLEVSEQDGKVVNFSHEVNLRLALPSSYQKKMFRAVNAGLSIDLYGSITPDKLNEKSEFEQFKSYQLKASDLKIYIGSCPEVSWYQKSIKQKFDEFLGDSYAHPYGQVKRVVDELAVSASESSCIPLTKNDEYVVKVKELLEEARVAFKEPTPDPDDLESSYSNLWQKTPSEIKAFARTKEKSDREELLRDYDELWSKKNIGAILSNRARKVHSKYDVRPPSVVELENVAFSLWNLKPLWSPLLSKLLISALLYAEIEAFASSLDSKRFSSLDEPLKTGPNSFFELIKNSLVYIFKDVGGLALEAMYVGITYLIASVITNNNEVAAWTVTTGFTLWRWGRNLFSYVHVGKDKNLSDLLGHMVATHAMADRPFNSKLLRAELYRVTALGAVFSPWVFSLLDKQIEHEDGYFN